MTKGAAVKYSDQELAWIKKYSSWPRRAAHKKFCSKFNRNDVSLNNYKALCKRNGWLTGRTGQFDKGVIPANKGKKMPYNANSARTQFKPGARQGVAIKLYKPIGTERITIDGYIERKINDDMPLQARWRAVHLIRWEEKNGKLPKGMCLKCLDGNRENTDPVNWKVISRGALPFLNGGKASRGQDYEKAHPEVRPAILAVAELKSRKSKLSAKQREKLL